MINISLHIRKLPPARGGGYSDLNFGQLKSEVHILGGGYSGVVKTQNAKICLNFNFGGGLRGEGEGVLWSSQIKTQSQDLAKFQFLGGGVPWFWNSREGCSGEFGQKFTVHTETCLCITDSLSHITYVETNKRESENDIASGSVHIEQKERAKKNSFSFSLSVNEL